MKNKPMSTYDEPCNRSEHQDARDAIGCRCDWTPSRSHRFKCPALGAPPPRLTANKVGDVEAEATYVEALAALRAAKAARDVTDTPVARAALANAIAAVRVAGEPLDAATRWRIGSGR